MRTRHSYIQIRNMRERGYSWLDIMREIGCSRDTVWRALSGPDGVDRINKASNERKKRYREQLRNGPDDC